MLKKIGFIGNGNMAKAMIAGLINSKFASTDEILVSGRNIKTLNAIQKEYSVEILTDSKELVKKSKIIILAVKPDAYDLVLKEILQTLKKDQIIISIAAGKTIESIEKVIGGEFKIVRSMPNTPVFVQEGMSAICSNKNIIKEEEEYVLNIFKSFGEAKVIEEKNFHSVIGVSGSSPAYVFMFIEALADAAVLGGMKRDDAYYFASQAVLGSAKMVLDSNIHPAKLKDMVCSPGGTTIEAVKSLEENGFRSAIINAVSDCMNKSKQMQSK